MQRAPKIQNMSIKTHHVIVSLFIGAIALASLAWLGGQAPTALATCSTGASVSLAAPTSGQTLTGVVSLNAAVPSTPQASGVTFEITSPSLNVLGSVSAPTPMPNGPAWLFNWDSHSVPDGNYNLVAIAHYGTNTTYDCVSTAVPVTVYNSSAGSGSQNSSLAVNISPATWEGIPGQKQQFSVSGVYTDSIGVQHPATPANGATYQWSTNAGSLASSVGPSTTLTDGPATGTFNIGVIVKMNGLTANKAVAVKIVPPGTATASSGPSPTPTPATAAGGDGTTVPLTAEQIQALSTMPTIFRPTNATNSDPVVPVQTLGCLQQKLGDKFSQISSGQSQPTVDDRVKGSSCFSGANKIPAALAPVDPTKLSDVPSTGDLVTLDSIKNETITGKSGSKITAILLGGSGTPNASVYLYIFSDPMVLRAQADGQGKWSYVLEDPLKPGHHELFAVSQKDSASFVRTPAVPVSIAAASPGNSDGSLIIEHSLTPTQIGYVAGSAVMVLAALVLMLRLLRRRQAAPPVPATAPATAPAPAAPEETTAPPDASPGVGNPPSAAPAAAPQPATPENHDTQT
jgi:hypothetical protein